MTITEICSLSGLFLTAMIFVCGKIGQYLRKISTSYDALKEQYDDMQKEKVSREELKEYLELSFKPINNAIDRIDKSIDRIEDFLNKITVINVKKDD